MGVGRGKGGRGREGGRGGSADVSSDNKDGLD